MPDRDVFGDDEDSRLEMALHDPDRLLTESLRVDERRRRVRRIVSVTLLIGGILMGTTLMAVLAGWLTLAAPQAGDSSPSAGTSKPAATAHAAG